MPPIPMVSAIVWFSPKPAGTSKSRTVASCMSHLDHVDHVVGTVERGADARPRPRSRGCAPTSRGRRLGDRHGAVSSRSGSMSCSTTRASASSGKENTSPSRSRVNTTLPAPMMAMVGWHAGETMARVEHDAQVRATNDEHSRIRHARETEGAAHVRTRRPGHRRRQPRPAPHRGRRARVRTGGDPGRRRRSRAGRLGGDRGLRAGPPRRGDRARGHGRRRPVRRVRPRRPDRARGRRPLAPHRPGRRRPASASCCRSATARS